MDCPKVRQELIASPPLRALQTEPTSRNARPETTERPERPERSIGLASHLASCAGCAAFARRLELAHEVIAGEAPSPGIEPDQGFSARVLARLQLLHQAPRPARARSSRSPGAKDPAGVSPRAASPLPRASAAELLGWAALRTLPAALALGIAVAGLGAGFGLLRTASATSVLVDEPSARQLWGEASPGWSADEPSSSQLFAWSLQRPVDLQ